MFTDRKLCVHVVAVAMTASLGLAHAVPAQSRTTAIRATAPRAVPAPGTIAILHSFAGSDGANPQGGLQYGFSVTGGTLTTTLFGAAQAGGAAGDGTLFSQGTQAGAAFTDLFGFRGTDGSTPTGGLSGILNSYTFDGPFVGVTTAGGSAGAGAIYAATANGQQTVLYSFTGGKDGANPVGRLVFKSGYFYGTTSAGGRGFGTIFRFSPLTGKFTTLHTFTGGNDGGTPLAGLALRLTIPASSAAARTTALSGRTIDARRAAASFVDSNLYGTTSNGGAAGTGNGTLFKISPAGALTTLFTFTDSVTNPGATPSAELATDFNGNLYGTTVSGGSAGLGEVFIYSAQGALSVVHDFGVDPVSGVATTGGNPLAPLTVAFDGTVYGTTSAGSLNGLGNVFEISASGFTLKYEFGGPDGASPEGGLIDGLNGSLYGTTSAGGANGLGTIFNIAE